MKVNLRIDSIEVVDGGLLIKDVAILDKSGQMIRKAKLNEQLSDLISLRVDSANVIFKSKAEELRYFDAMRKKYKRGDVLDEKDSRDMFLMLRRNSISHEFISFKVDKDGYNNSAFHGKNKNGDWIAFSPRASIYKTSDNANFIEVCRSAIEKDIAKIKEHHLSLYKNGDKTISCLSGEWFDINDIHVDHWSPKFKDIVNTFMSFVDVEKIEIDKRNGLPNRFNNKTIINLFRIFHSIVGTFRVISSFENTNRNMSDYKQSALNNYRINNYFDIENIATDNELIPDSLVKYNKLKEKNPLIEKLFETLDLKIINE